MKKTIDVLLYVDRLDAYRVDNLDKQVVKAITESFGKDIWHKAMVVLTHAQLSPPDALSYEEFFSKRSESLLKCVRQGARISKKEVQVYSYFYYLYFLEPCFFCHYRPPIQTYNKVNQEYKLSKKFSHCGPSTQFN